MYRSAFVVQGEMENFCGKPVSFSAGSDDKIKALLRLISELIAVRRNHQHRIFETRQPDLLRQWISNCPDEPKLIKAQARSPLFQAYSLIFLQRLRNSGS